MSFCAATALATWGVAKEPPAEDVVRFTFHAPHPAHNPAFNYAETPEGELLIWQAGEGDKFVGFRLNRPAYRLWKCFDGKTAAGEAVENSGGSQAFPENTARSIVRSMEEKKILVHGGEVVLGHGMEIPPEGSVYVANVRKLQDSGK